MNDTKEPRFSNDSKKFYNNKKKNSNQNRVT